MRDSNELFREIFDTCDIVKRWEEKGYDHVGTIFSNGSHDIIFPMDSGVTIQKWGRERTLDIDMEMFELIYETKHFIMNLSATCDMLCNVANKKKEEEKY